MSLHHLKARAMLCAILLLGSADAIAAGMASRPLDQKSLPSDLEIEGKFIAALGWTDFTGENGAVLSRSLDDGSRGRSVKLLAVGYRITSNGTLQVWKVQDWEEHCQVDLTGHFERRSFEVTDLDRNGIGEVSFVYRLGCNGGMDFVGEKLMLIENGKKYPVRGASEFKYRDKKGNAFYDGPMTVDEAFIQAPPAFRVFAVKKWRKFRVPESE